MRKFIARILKWQAVKFLAKIKPKVVVVTGSVGKTSTTQAIAVVLSEKFNVRTTLQNYNTDVGVPCSIFAHKFPESLKNPISWLFLIFKNQLQIFGKSNIEVLVLELGTDSKGEIATYSWLKPDIAIVTAVAPEHMEYFVDLESVAREELSVSSYSDKTIINKNMVDPKYLEYVDSDQLFNYSREDIAHLPIKKDELQVIADHGIDAITAGIAVGKVLGLVEDELVQGARKVKPLIGRMNPLKGIQDSTLIDDTYNSSPEAVTAALDYLYDVKASQRIALLGNMNELGETSENEHKKIGEYCNPKKLDLVVTLGVDANNFTAKSAKGAGCNVVSVDTPYEAANAIKNVLKDGAYILLKGSQNGVFAEEATKLLLQNPEDKSELVRQSNFWMKIKEDNFKEL